MSAIERLTDKEKDELLYRLMRERAQGIVQSPILYDTKSERHNMRMYPGDYQFMQYWTEKLKMEHSSELLIRSMYHYVGWVNQDFDLPTAEIQRMNQLTELVQGLISTLDRLTGTVTEGFDTMLGVIKGDNYLVETEKGDL